jgi:hypothetical protein
MEFLRLLCHELLTNSKYYKYELIVWLRETIKEKQRQTRQRTIRVMKCANWKQISRKEFLNGYNRLGMLDAAKIVLNEKSMVF